MPNKEECLTAIDVVARYCNEVKQGHIPPRFELTNELDVLMKVVEEHFELKESKKRVLENSMHLLDRYKRLEIIFETATSWEEAKERYINE